MHIRTPYSHERSYFGPRNVKRLENYNPKTYDNVKALRDIGIVMDEDWAAEMANSKTLREMATFAMDAIPASIQPTITTASIQVPIQFLQNWLPGFVFVVTAPREIDEFVGISTSGSWE